MSADPSCTSAAQVPCVVAPVGTREDPVVNLVLPRATPAGLFAGPLARRAVQVGTQSVARQSCQVLWPILRLCHTESRGCCMSSASNSRTPPMSAGRRTPQEQLKWCVWWVGGFDELRIVSERADRTDR